MEASLTAEKEKATRQVEESVAEVACMEGRSRTLHVHLGAAMSRVSVAEEKATMVMALMEAAKKGATKAMPRFKTSAKFIEEVREAIMDSFFKGFMECKVKVA